MRVLEDRGVLGRGHCDFTDESSEHLRHQVPPGGRCGRAGNRTHFSASLWGPRLPGAALPQAPLPLGESPPHGRWAPSRSATAAAHVGPGNRALPSARPALEPTSVSWALSPLCPGACSPVCEVLMQQAPICAGAEPRRSADEGRT